MLGMGDIELGSGAAGTERAHGALFGAAPAQEGSDPRSWVGVGTPYALRLLGAVALLGAEAALLRTSYSTDALLAREDLWARALLLTRFNEPILVGALLGAALVIGPTRFAALFARWTDAPSRRVTSIALFVHLAAFVTFLGASHLLLEAQPPTAIAWALAILWPVLGIGLCAALFAAAVGPQNLVASARALAAPGILGAALGVSAVAVGARIAAGWLLVEPLTRATLHFAYAIVSLVVPSATLDAEADVLGNELFLVHVTKYCSGYEGMGLFCVFFAVFLGLARDRLRFPRVLWLLPVGALVAWTLNGVRIAFLVILGAIGYPEVAMGGFHTHAGWPLVCVTALGAAALSLRSPVFARGPHRENGGVENPALPWLLPIVVSIGAALVLGAFVAEPQLVTPLGSLLGLAVVWRHRHAYGTTALAEGAGPHRSWIAPGLGTLGALVWALGAPLHDLAEDDGTQLAWQADLPLLFLAGWWAARLTASIAVAPLVEELAFRGYLTRVLVDWRFERLPVGTMTTASLLMSSVVFGIMHENVTGGIACGLCYGLALRARGRMLDAVVAHGVTNALLWAWAACSDSWHLVL
jgi:exosortase E/protease (VPEID-CTERM system)